MEEWVETWGKSQVKNGFKWKFAEPVNEPVKKEK